MVVATFETAIAVGTTEALERSFMNAKELSPDDVQTLILTCDFIHGLFKKGRAHVESDLRRGMNARDFVAQHAASVSGLDIVKTRVDQILEREKKSYSPSLGAELISRYENMAADLANFRKFLVEALARAKKPLRPIDWQRVREVEEAYARGATKPFRKTIGKRGGS